MANTTVTYTWGTGDPNAFTVPFAYLQKTHVHVYVNEVEDLTFTWATDSSVAVGVSLADQDSVRVTRTTPRDALTTVIPNSGTYRGADINNQSLQALYVAEEGYDALIGVMGLDISDTYWDAVSKQIKNVADPSADQDAVTKLWAETSMSSQLASAISSASGAASSASASSTSASNAATSESNASSSASAASTSASNASTSESNAASSASAASTSASNAATSETNASSSASAASTSASNASTSESNAAVSESNAAASYDSFDDRYLGPKASAPTLDNDSNALIEGALYWHSTENQMYAWDGSAWDGMYFSGDLSLYLLKSGGVMTGNLDLDGNSIIFDVDGDSYLQQTADDTVRMYCGSAQSMVWTSSFVESKQALYTPYLYVTIDLDVAGSAQIDTNLTVDGVFIAGTHPMHRPQVRSAYVLWEDNNAFTTDHATDDKLDVTAHPYVNGDMVYVETTATLPTGLAADTAYYVINATTNDFELSTSFGGSAVDVNTSNGSGTHTIYKPVRMIASTLDIESDGSIEVKAGSVLKVI